MAYSLGGKGVLRVIDPRYRWRLRARLNNLIDRLLGEWILVDDLIGLERGRLVRAAGFRNRRASRPRSCVCWEP
jgi:hypothetical protein